MKTLVDLGFEVEDSSTRPRIGHELVQPEVDKWPKTSGRSSMDCPPCVGGLSVGHGLSEVVSNINYLRALSPLA